MTSKNIFILDDEPWGIDPYIRELKRRGYGVSVHTAWPGLQGEIRKNQIRIDLLILDIMLPGHAYVSFGDEFFEASEGRRAGLVIGELLRKHEFRSPIIFLSSISEPSIIAAAKEFERTYENSAFFAKGQSNTSLALADTIDVLFSTGKLSKDKSGILTLLSDALVLKPSIFGMGIDLNKLISKLNKQ